MRFIISSWAYSIYRLSNSTRSFGLDSCVVGSCISLASSRLMPRKLSILVAIIMMGTSAVCSDTALKRLSVAVCVVRSLLISRQNLYRMLNHTTLPATHSPHHVQPILNFWHHGSFLDKLTKSAYLGFVTSFKASGVMDDEISTIFVPDFIPNIMPSAATMRNLRLRHI